MLRWLQRRKQRPIVHPVGIDEIELYARYVWEVKEGSTNMDWIQWKAFPFFNFLAQERPKAS